MTLSNLPDDTRCALIVGQGDMTVGELREALRCREESERVLTTGEAAETFGYAASTWAKWADEGLVDGAYRDDGDSGYWRLPLVGCRDHLADLRRGRNVRRRKRGPWKEAAPAQTGRAGTEGVPAWTVLRGGPEAVGRRQADDAEPEGPELAEAG